MRPSLPRSAPPRRRGSPRIRSRVLLAALLFGASPAPPVAAAEEAPGAGSGLEASPEAGVVWTDPERPLRIRPRALLALDYREYDDRNTRASGLRLDRALLGVDVAAWDRFSARLLADLRGTDTTYGVEEAWGAVEIVPKALRLTAGVQRIALGIESSFPEQTLPFVEYGSTAFLTTRNDVAATLDGEFAEGWLSYVASVGVGEGFDLLGNPRHDPQLSLRLVAYPFLPVDFTIRGIPLLSGFFLSAGGAHSWDYASRLEYANSFRNDLVSTRRIDADVARAYHLGYGFDLGPVRLTHEFARQSLLGVELPDGTSRDFERQNAGWSASIAWRITGEPYDSRPYRQREHPPDVPARPFHRDGRFGPGMIEVAARYSNFEIDRDLIDLGFTSAAIAERFSTGVSSQESRTFDFAVNWVPYTPLRLGFQITRTLADQRPAAFGSHGRDTSFLFRVQVSY